MLASRAPARRPPSPSSRCSRSSPAFARGDEKSIQWLTDLPEGLALAAKTRKPVVVAFAAAWCPSCRRFMFDTFPAREVQDLADDFVWVSIDIDRELTIARAGALLREPARLGAIVERPGVPALEGPVLVSHAGNPPTSSSARSSIRSGAWCPSAPPRGAFAARGTAGPSPTRGARTALSWTAGA